MKVFGKKENSFYTFFYFLVFITAVSLHAQSYIKEHSINLSITWNGPTELSHGIFQGYELFYRDTTLGNETKVILRTTGDTFYVIQNLVPNTKYLITARSFTLEGDGKMSEPLVIWTGPLGTLKPCAVDVIDTLKK